MKIEDKRHTVTMRTLTPVHVGSGNLLQNNIEFVEDNIEEDCSDIFVIDPKKVIGLIGIHNVDTWVTALETGEELKGLIARLGGCSDPEKFSKRVITNYAGIKKNTTLKESIHDARGLAYIPGSSIKGAIRTAVLATIAAKKSARELEELIKSNRFSGSNVEKLLFGNTPNESIFRFLQIGDAYFPEQSEISLNAININITQRESLIDNGKAQVIEAIAEEKATTFTIKLASQQNKEFSSQNKVMRLPQEMSSIEELFCTINSHTLKLVESEIEFWKKVSEVMTDGENYIENLETIKNVVGNCTEGKECVLRIGHASGWRFTTGAWTEELGIFEEIVNISRPGNKKQYNQYDFPKTRHVGDEYSDIFGFVKLTIAE